MEGTRVQLGDERLIACAVRKRLLVEQLVEG
jgi:hypothetical protein